MDRLINRWQALNPRERALVSGAVALALVVLVVSLGRPLLAAADDARERLERAREDVAWLQAQVASGRLSPVRCGGGDAPLVDLAARHGVTIGEENQHPDGGVRLPLAAADGNGVLALVRDLDCRGHGLVALNLVRDGSGVRGEARFHRSVTKSS